MKLICRNCSASFKLPPSKVRKGGGVYCSRTCADLGRRGKMNRSRGVSKPSVSGEKNGMWKGALVGYLGIHSWVARKMGKAKDHQCSMACGDCGGRMEWSNISRQYRRDLSDWRPLCVVHHRRTDPKRQPVL